MASHRKVNTKGSYSPDNFSYPVDPRTLTVPDESLTIRQLLLRYKKGMPPEDYTRVGEYDDDNLDSVDPRMRINPDLTDFDDYKEEYENLQTQVRARIAENRARKQSKGAKGDLGNGESHREERTPTE